MTNATGLVKNLNAEKLDGATKDDFVAKGGLLFAQVGANGAIGGNRGVPANSSAAFTASGTNQVASVPFSGDISKCAVTATPAEVPSNAAAAPPSVVAAINADKTHVDVTEVNAGTVAYGVHVQVVC